MFRPVIPFAMATLVPLPLLALGTALGGVWTAAALLYLTLVTFTLDQLIHVAAPHAPEGTGFPAADRLSAALALAHFAALPLGIWAVGGSSGLGTAERVAAFLGFGLFLGQISIPNAHELIHCTDKRLFALGKWVYISLLFGHHTSAHRQVHHVHAATPRDPNSAPLGMSYYRFAPRAWAGSFRAGLAAETRAMACKSPPPPRWRHPYLAYVLGGLACLIAVALVFGAGGLAAYLGLAAHAQAQLLLADYVQHYGLRRAMRPDGRYEPLGARHSWDSPHWFTSYMMLNAPRHSDHHAHPARRFPALRLQPEGQAPTLPLSLPAMATLALVPRAWRRVMDARARQWLPKAGPASGTGAGALSN
ncbi:alkane 1-monooxygenase [Rhodovulum iodosum]|uniref:Alkane 1-monooxygenase n=1 Tax=Rhodovulum iodosum TaxID=68291 RepID=A0ABV3XNU6_9RHOB|nr:alkane 1-monooxygenase [Rhodovulum robiginosum]RSK34869.1 alkane 1-monooxygenase [Rhodovulum robiginosum]